MDGASLFCGFAVVIDDKFGVDGDIIQAIAQAIGEGGCHVVGMNARPTEPQLDGLRTASFFVLDWRLFDLGEGVDVPAQLKRQNAADNIALIKALRKRRFAPIFIFTNEEPKEVRAALEADAELQFAEPQSHIFVVSKGEVRDRGVFAVLSDWLAKNPTAYVLKQWEREYEAAKNKLFLDFHSRSEQWPLILWKSLTDDGVSESEELGRIIGRNLLSRMSPFEFDMAPFADALASLDFNDANYREMLKKVLEGERFVAKDQLHGPVAPGDIFKTKDKYYINIRPDCDCIARDGQAADAVELYLLEGSKATAKQMHERYISTFGFNERHNEALVYPVANGAAVIFQLANITIETWGARKDSRIGRLLPPYLTRLQKRYASYLQRPGLSRLPQEAMPPVPAPAAS